MVVDLKLFFAMITITIFFNARTRNSEVLYALSYILLQYIISLSDYFLWKRMCRKVEWGGNHAKII